MIRHKIIPVLKEINPRLGEAAAAAAELLREDEEMLSDIADLFIEDLCIGLTANVVDLLNLPFAVSSRVIRKLYGGNLSIKHVKAVLELCANESPSSSLSLPGLTVFREYDRIVFEQNNPAVEDGFAHLFPTDGDSVIILGAGLLMSCNAVICDEKTEVSKTFNTFLFKSIDICGKIAVRPRREGDTIKLVGQNGTKTLKKLFIERRIPARKRPYVPVISDDKGVLAIYGIGTSDRAVPKPGDDAILIVFEEIM